MDSAGLGAVISIFAFVPAHEIAIRIIGVSSASGRYLKSRIATGYCRVLSRLKPPTRPIANSPYLTSHVC